MRICAVSCVDVVAALDQVVACRKMQPRCRGEGSSQGGRGGSTQGTEVPNCSTCNDDSDVIMELFVSKQSRSPGAVPPDPAVRCNQQHQRIIECKQ